VWSRVSVEGSTGWDQLRIASIKTRRIPGSNWLEEQRSSSVNASFGRTGFFVDTLRCDRIVGIGDGDDARTMRDLLALESAGIARAVIKFMVVTPPFP